MGDAVHRVEQPQAVPAEVRGGIATPAESLEVGARAVLAGEEAAREREAGHHAQLELLSDAREVALVLAAVHEVVVVLHGDHRSDAELTGRDSCLEQAVSRVVAATEVANPAIANQLVDGEQCLVERH